MMARWLKRIAVLLLLLLLQGPAMLMQEIAWIGMLVRYSNENGVVQGVVETFDGRHPCPLCCKAEGLRQETRQREQPADQQRERQLFQWLACAPMLPASLLRLRDLEGTEVVRLSCPGATHPVCRGREAPPIPPPRV